MDITFAKVISYWLDSVPTHASVCLDSSDWIFIDPQRIPTPIYRDQTCGLADWTHRGGVLDILEFLSRKFAVSMALQKGDIQFINNLSILHGRMSYEDSSTNR